MDRALSTILGLVVAGIMLLIGLAIVLTVTNDEEPFEVVLTPVENDFPAVVHDPDAARELLEAWTRWRSGTFVTIGTWTRTLDERPDDPLVGDVYHAQLPPRRYQVRLGSVTVDITEPDEYEVLVGSDLSVIGGYVLGPDRLYDVSVGDEPGCFRAELVVPALASPWGRWAEYCFDADSTALRSAIVRRQSAIDVEQTTSIRTDVTDADFG